MGSKSMSNYNSNKKFVGAIFFIFFFALVFVCSTLRAQSYEDRELTSQNLVLPELEQFYLGSRLFWEKNKKIAAWKAFQTFLFNYPDSPLAADAQFMVAESIFSEAIGMLEAGNSPDEIAWRRGKKGGMKVFGKGIKKSLDGLKYIGAKVAGEPEPIAEPDRIDFATFSEAILQYQRIVEEYKKSGLVDTALFRMAESFYNMGDYPMALEYFKRIQKQFPQSYLIGETMLGSAQCYIPGGDFGSAELEVNKLTAAYPHYEKLPQVQFILGIIRFQEGKYEEAYKYLEKIETAEALYYSAQALLKMERALSATAKFKKVAQEYKESRFAELSAYLVGESFFLSKNYIGAIQEYKRFLNQYQQTLMKEGVLYKIAASHFLNKDYPASRESFNLLLNTYPSGEFASLARYFIAESYRLANQLKEASFSYGQLISAMPNAPMTASGRFKLAWVTYLQKNYSAAADSFQRFIDWNPFHEWVPHAYLLMGNCYILLGHPGEAVNAYQQAFDRAPKTELAESAMALLNRTRYVQGNYGQLTSAYTYILKSLPPSESKWRSISQLYLADSYYRQKLFKEAIAVFQSIISLYPNHPVAVQALDGLSWCYFQLGDYDQSQKVRQSIQDVRLPEGVAAPSMTSGGYELANAFFNQKKYMEALSSYEKYIQENPGSKDIPEAIFRIGLCYYRQEYYSQAIQIWEDLEKQFPKDPRTEEAVYQVADTYFKAQKYDKAIETYRKFIAQYPKNVHVAEATLRIGQSYYNAGDDDKAVSELDAFLRKFPKDSKFIETLDLLESALDRMESSGGGSLDLKRQRGMAVLKKLVEDFPRSDLASECQFRIARKFFNWKEYSEAVKEFEKLALTYPESSHIAESEFHSGESNYLLKKYPEAIISFQRFLRNFSTSEFAPATMFHLGTSFFNTQKYDGAIETYQNLLQQFPESEYASAGLFNLALSRKKLQKLPEAADAYMKLALNYPNDSNVKFALLEVGKIKKDLKQYGEAILVLKDLDTKIPVGDEQKLEIACLIGESYVANNDLEEAARTLKSVNQMPPHNSSWHLEALRLLGEVYEKQEKWSDAVAIYDEGGRLNASFKERAKYIRQNYLGNNSNGSSEPKKKQQPKTTGAGQ